MRSARQPLAIIGKGAAWARAEEQVRRFIDETHLPFLASPMGKGVVPDDHPLSVAAARTYALQNADLVFLIGARLNWIMHFGLPPRFRKDLRVVQLDIAAEEIGTNVPTEVPLVGDAKAVMTQMVAALEEDPWQVSASSPWRQGLQKELDAKRAATVPLLESDDVPMNYYRPLKEIQDALPRDAIIVTEGAMVVLIIKPDDHGGIFGQLDQQGVQTPHAMAPEHVDLVPEHLAVNDLGIAGGKNTVPQQTHLLQEGGRGGDHALQPVLPIGPRPHHAGLLVMKAPDHIIPHPLRRGGIDQRLHRGVVALRRRRLALRTGGAETGAAHQLGDQCNVVCTHIISLSLVAVVMPLRRCGAGEVGQAS